MLRTERRRRSRRAAPEDGRPHAAARQLRRDVRALREAEPRGASGRGRRKPYLVMCCADTTPARLAAPRRSSRRARSAATRPTRCRPTLVKTSTTGAPPTHAPCRNNPAARVRFPPRAPADARLAVPPTQRGWRLRAAGAGRSRAARAARRWLKSVWRIRSRCQPLRSHSRQARQPLRRCVDHSTILPGYANRRR